jgi:hypothetical protein
VLVGFFLIGRHATRAAGGVPGACVADLLRVVEHQGAAAAAAVDRFSTTSPVRRLVPEGEARKPRAWLVAALALNLGLLACSSTPTSSSTT